MQLGNKRLFKHKDVYFHYSLKYISASDVKSAHTHVTVSFWSVMHFGLRGEVGRNWEGME